MLQKDEKKKEDANQLAKSVKDRCVLPNNCRAILIVFHSNKIAIEAQHGLIAQVLKDVIFSIRPGTSADPAAVDSALAHAGESLDTAMSIG